MTSVWDKRMSQPSGKKGAGGAGKGPPKDSKNNEDKEQKDAAKAAASKDQAEKEKDETASNAGEEAAAPKPQSAGTNVRDAAQKVLALCQKGEWAPVDQVLKSIEKAATSAGEDAVTNPLLGVADPVCKVVHMYVFISNNSLWKQINFDKFLVYSKNAKIAKI